MKANSVNLNPKEAFNLLYLKYMSNLSSWVHTLKCFIIFHSALQDIQSAHLVSKDINAKSSNMSSFLKPFEDKSFGIDNSDQTRHNEIIKVYLEYIKFMSGFVEHEGILFMHPKELQKYIENIPLENAFALYSDLENLLTLGLKVF